MTSNKKYIFWGLIITLFLGVCLYNPKVEINISENTINDSVDKQLPIKSNISIINFNAVVDDLDIKLLEDGTALIDFNFQGELKNGTTFSAKGVASSKLWYEDGKIYLEEPWIEKIDKYDYELQGKEKVIKDLYKKSQTLFNKVSGNNYTINKNLVDKAKDKLSTALEYIPVYNLNPDNSLKGWVMEQATGDIKIDESKVTAILYPFGLILKIILLGSLLILFTVAAIKNPEFAATLIRIS